MNNYYIQYILVLLLFGSNGIVASYIFLDSYEIVYARAGLAALFLIALFFLTKQRVQLTRYKKEAFYLMLGGFGLGLSWIFLFEAYAQIGVSVATLLYYCGPVLVMLIAPLLFKEKLTVVKMIGFAIVLIGMGCLNSEAFLQGELSVGVIYGLLAAVMYAVMVIFNKKNQAIQGVENTMLQLIAAFIIVALYVTVKQGPFLTIEASSIAPLVMLAVVNTALGCVIYFKTLNQLPVQSVSVLGYIEPLSALLFSTVVLQEQLTTLQFIGAACILGGAAFAELYRPKRTAIVETTTS